MVEKNLLLPEVQGQAGFAANQGWETAERFL